MKLRLRIAWSFVRSRPWQSLLSVCGVALGIAVVLAIDITNESARRAFRMSNDAVSIGSSHYIYGGPQGIDEDVYVDLRVNRGIRDISPVVSGYVSLGGRRFLLLGIDPFAGSAHRPDGRLPADRDPAQLLRGSNSMLILDTTAKRLRLPVPADVMVEIGGTRYAATIAGTINPVNAIHRSGLRNVLIADISTAQSLLGMIGKLSRIDLATDDPASVEQRLPKPLRLIPNEARSHVMEQMTRAFHLNLTALSLLAMVIGAFLIYNTMTLSVLQRREQFAVLRTLGMTPSQLFSDRVAEALVLATAGLAVGIPAGVWLGKVLLQMVSTTINDLYFVMEIQSVAVPASSLVKAGLLGFIMTVVAALHPAWECIRINPAMNATRSLVESTARTRSKPLMLGGLCCWGIAVVVLILSERSIVAGFAALFMIIIGFALVTPFVLSGILQLAGAVLGRSLGVVANMAVRGVQASLSRTQIAVAALAIAVSAVVGVSVMISSFRTSVEHWLDNFLRADIYVAQQHVHLESGIDRTLIDKVKVMPGVANLSTGRWVELQGRDRVTRIFAVDLDREGFTSFQLLDGGHSEIWPQFENADVVIISEPYAYRHQLQAGDSVQLVTDSGPTKFDIAGIFYDYGSDQGVVTMHRNTYNRHWNDSVISSFAVYLQENVDAEMFVDRLNSDELIDQTLRVRSTRTIRDKSLQIFDRTFVVTDVLRLLAICIAVVGILSALLAIQLERAREFAVLRAIGMSPGQLWRLIVAESGLMGLISGLIACPLGFSMAWVLIAIINRRSFGWSLEFYFEPGPWIMAILLSVIAAIVAGLYPAARMAKSRTEPALRYE